MADKPEDLQGTRTQQPRDAQMRVTVDAIDIFKDEDAWEELGNDLYNIYYTATTARKDFNDNLEAWNALYELEIQEQDWPWVGAANLNLPIIPAEVDTMFANAAAQVFVQRLIIVTAGDDDPDTARMAPQLEKYYNAELRRIRSDGKTPIEALLTIMHLGIKDGGGPCDVVIQEREEPRLIITEEPEVVELADGSQGVDTETEDGAPRTKKVVTKIIDKIREVVIIPHLLKEWYINPDESTSLNNDIMTTHWMKEKEMMEMVRSDKNPDGPFKLEAVQQVMDWLTVGQTDVSRDELGDYDKTAGGQIEAGQGQGALTSRFFKNRGPAKVMRLFSEAFDMDGDDIAEKNIFWFYPFQPLMLGYEPYEYATPGWPEFMFAPFPRPNRPYGYSFVERLADIAAEANAGRNQRRNYIDMQLLPILLQREGDSIRDRDRAIYPGAPWTVEDVEKSVRYFAPGALSQDPIQDEGRLDVYVSKLSGQNAPALGAQGAGRRSATETRMTQVAQSVRTGLVAMLYRFFLRAVMQHWHLLNKQYLIQNKDGLKTNVSEDLAKLYDGKAGDFTLSPEILKRKFNIDIAGLSDPVDANNRRQEFLGALTVAAKVFPWIFGDPEKAYAMAEAFFDTFQLNGIERFIGSADEAKKRKEAMGEQNKKQQQMADQEHQARLQAIAQGKNPPASNGQSKPASGATGAR